MANKLTILPVTERNGYLCFWPFVICIFIRYKHLCNPCDINLHFGRTVCPLTSAVSTSSHVIYLFLSLPDHLLSFRSLNISYISLFLQDRRARVETIRSTETIAAVILVNKVNKIQALHIQTSTFIHMFMSDILHLLTIITFECDISFTFIMSISATFFLYIHF